MKSPMTFLAAMALAFLIACPSPAQVSLWDAVTPASDPNILRQVKARDFQTHDIIHVIVSVSAEASTDEDAKLEEKTDKLNFFINEYLRLKHDGGLKVNIEGNSPDDLTVDMGGDKKYEGKGNAGRTDTLRARLAAEVVDLKPNGNVVIEATSRVTKNRETTTITISGLVRPQDVAADNTVYSYNVADVDIKYESSGPISDSSKRGWLLKFIDKIWPF